MKNKRCVPRARHHVEYTLVSGVALDFAYTGWVEAKEATFDGTMIGFIVQRVRDRGQPYVEAVDADADGRRDRRRSG